MRFEIFHPCELLKPYVDYLAIQENPTSNTYRVLPDTGLVIGFQYQGKLSRLKEAGEVLLSSSGISGLADHSRTFRNVAGTGTLLVVFKAAGAAVFFREPLHELFRESVSLDNFMLRSELLLLEEQLCEATTDSARIEIIERFLINRMKATVPDEMVLGALSLIHKNKGNIRITALMEQLHISQSPLEKRFRQMVGTSPKKFAAIVRFKHTLQAYRPAISLTELGYEAGYYDQAHFIKEFKTFTGDTPERFFGGR